MFDSIKFNDLKSSITLLSDKTVAFVSGEMTVGDLVYVNGLLAQLSVPMRFASFVYRDVQEAIIDMEALFFLKNKQSDIKVCMFLLLDFCNNEKSTVDF